MTEHRFMEEALREAWAAGKRGECPVGAVLVRDGKIVARAGNEEIAAKDPTAHAEMLCLRRAGTEIGSHVFTECTMYTTLWPCPMCQGAMLQAQVPRVVVGATSFTWITEVRFAKENLVIEGPVSQESCRRLFIDWARRCNRLEILDYEG